MKLVKTALALALLQSLLACTTVGPDYRVPDQSAIKNPTAAGQFIGAHDPAVAIAPVPDDWWKLYDDAQLNGLVQQAMSANTDLRVASANLRRAVYIMGEVDAESGLHGGVDFAAKRAQESGESFLLTEKLPVLNEGDVGLSVSYDLDLFGKLKRGEEAAHANAEAAQAALDLARVNVVAQTVRAYVMACSANRELSVAQHELDLQNHSVDVTRRMASAGRGRSTDVLRAEAQADLLRANLPRFQSDHDAAMFQLAVMVGKTPAEMNQMAIQCNEEPKLAQAIPVGDGAALLKRRPDIREAERQLAAATAKIGVATADLYPDIKIGASIGSTGILEDLGTPAANRWGIGPLITWTIPDSGSHARIHAAEAGADAALAHFDGVVLSALKETETALTRYTHDLQRNADLRAARDKARQVAAENRTMYKAGRAPFLTSLDSDRTLASADAALAASDSQLAQDQINLFLSLGGGWQSAAKVENTAEK
ncbi:efflux transporter outer membrane subunit [Silvimonas iriomotensis]|uniref:RND transporter n=1 Tax=Silvimonas iriomotensis TaxID=449662 RepID=A0ABQ2PFK4_9NEIS|nr:efflux transporter outer membrane subunit [Silvimonas iriomotensis]GGP24098.1 RND transporter [Silvimonas iriomotensis]